MLDIVGASLSKQMKVATHTVRYTIGAVKTLQLYFWESVRAHFAAGISSDYII